MRVLVTGGAGHVGKATTARLVQQGWEVRVIGLESGVDIPGAEFVTCDILNYAEVRELIRGCDAVVHLAGIRGPQLAEGHRLFQVNVSGTFNVFEAAAAEGIRRIAQASSINALGCAYNIADFAPRYFPIDEEHPSATTDPYSYSKAIVEDVGRYYWRREGISSVSLRFPWVCPQEFIGSETFSLRRQTVRQALDELAALPEAARQARLAEARQYALDFRQQRSLEYKDGLPEPLKREQLPDPLWFIYTIDRFNLWAILDERDAAQALEKAITASYEGAHALFINDDHNWLGYDSAALVRLFYPEVNGSSAGLSGTSSLVSIDKARKLIGFTPEYSTGKLL